MGVPKFFRWLSKKYPTILAGCTVLEPSATNPTGEFGAKPFDNVYLDMNGILHNCAFNIVDIVRLFYLN
jgi:5'-3' exonuclease